MLFGLSMNHHILILSRIRERRPAGATTQEAVVGGTAAGSGIAAGVGAMFGERARTVPGRLNRLPGKREQPQPTPLAAITGAKRPAPCSR